MDKRCTNSKKWLLVLSVQVLNLDTPITDAEKLEAANQKIIALEAANKTLKDTVEQEIKKIPGTCSF